MSAIPTIVELKQEEIVRRLEEEAKRRLHMSAQEMVTIFREGRLDDPGKVMDLLALAGLLDSDHPLYIEP